MTQWHYRGDVMTDHTQFPENTFSFVYKITRISDGKFYIGKKLVFFQKTALKTVTLKNGTKKKKKIRSLVPSDWLSYWGSSAELLKDIDALGEEAFSREIVEFCWSKSHASYVEAKMQFDERVMELTYDETYNGIVNLRVAKAHVNKFYQS